MEDEVLLEMMASLIQEMYDEGQGSEFRPAMQNVLVAFNNRGLTPLAADGATCPRCQGVLNNDGYCLACGYPFPPRR